MNIYLMRMCYGSYYRYRKAIREYRDKGYIVRRVFGGVACYPSLTDYNIAIRQI